MGLLRLLGKLLFGSHRSHFHGFDGESLDPSIYHHFKNLIIPTSRGTSEIDHLIVSKYGLFVIELKDRSGWIFGNERDDAWTAVHFGKKHRFANPLRQNFGHVMALEELLRIRRESFHQAVVFRGEFEFKTRIPEGVLCDEYESWVESKTRVLLNDGEVTRIITTMKHVGDTGPSAMDAHVESLRERFASDTVCPRCGGNLVPRVARRGSGAGSTFLGCSNYPRCRFTKND